ncbi:MAG: mechanosensitive ion channel family protein [Nitrospiraceae bacterium]|nr:MAG: mechanosensitive ion channel family protein [Nitrospiraceae bacterium]
MEQFINDYIYKSDNPAISALILFAFYIVAAKIADLSIDKGFRRLTKMTTSEMDDKVIDFIHRPVFFTVVIIGCIHAVRILEASERFIFYSNGLLVSVLTFIWGLSVIRISNIVIENAVLKVTDLTGLGREVTPLVENIWKIIVIIAGATVILSVWKINITPLLASAGIAGAALAFAAKDTLSNFFGGISIFVDKPYKIGDYIVLDSKERGEVVRIGIRSTRIKTRDDVLITVPNAIISNTKIINESAPAPNFRVRVPVSVAYGSDIEKVEKLLNEIALSNENVLRGPEPRVRFRAFGESSLNFELLCWIKEPSLSGIAVHEINKAIYNKFNEAEITIPFPHRTVYLQSGPPS